MPTRPSRISNTHRPTPLPRHIQAIANGARRNPLVYLHRLVQLIRDEPAWAVHPQLLSAIFRQLDKDPPLHLPLTEYDLSCISNGFTALDGILIARMATRPPDRRRPLLDHSYILPAWPSIWKWIHFVYYMRGDGQLDTAFNAESRPMAFNLAMFNTIQCLLASIIIDDPSPALLSAVVASPGILKMATEIWIRQGDRPPEENVDVDATGPFTFGQALSAILQANPNEISELSDGFGTGPQAFAALLTRPIRFIVPQGEAQLRAYHPYITVYLELARQTPKFFKMVLAHNIMADILCGLAFLLSIRRPVPWHEAINPGIAVCFRFIIEAISLSTGYASVSDAIHLKLITSTLRYASRVKPPRNASASSDAIEPDLVLIVNILQRCVVHRPLLKVLRTFTRVNSVLSLAAQVREDTWFRSQWVQFLEHLEFVSTVHASFNRSEESKLKCSSSKCNNVETTERFRTCRGCHEVVYCSELCQREHWEYGPHREDCKTARELRSEQAFHVSLRDRAFFAFLADEQMSRDKQKIIELRDKALADRAVRPLTLCIDHSITPAIMSLEPAEDFHPANHYEPPSRTIVPLPPSSQSTPTPLIQPCFITAYGEERRAVVYTPSKVSGDLFGWFHDSGGEGEEHKGKPRRVYDEQGEAFYKIGRELGYA